jgi:ubiquinone/menaquinone biosynthesis C-methylase UbiE
MRGPDHDRARRQYRRRAGAYDRLSRPVERYRERAIERLELRNGDAVVDVACGTGLNFASIERRIGPSGSLLGIDLSPEMLAIARERTRDEGWGNVRLIEAAVEDAEIDAEADAALFSLTHDVLRSGDALDNVMRHLRPSGRVASFGAKWAPTWRAPVNLAVWLIARRYVTTFHGMSEPWSLLGRYADLEVEELALGGAYLASGAKR